ncbi:MAG: HutD family protein [Lachnospiraceae bacterium]|nr:HutD family protein [Lachnospiraceae bacterium]
MKIEKIEQDRWKISRWSGGSTTQFYIMPEDSVFAEHDFTWRLSAAVLEDEQSEFTRFPGYERILYLLSGISLIHVEQKFCKMLLPGDQIRFSGSDITKSRGRASDLNLIMREGCSGRMTGYPSRDRIEWKQSGNDRENQCWMFYMTEGSAEIQDIQNQSRIPLSPGDLLLVRPTEPEEELKLQIKKISEVPFQLIEIEIGW